MLEYRYNSIVWDPNMAIDIGGGRFMEVVGWSSFSRYIFYILYVVLEYHHDGIVWALLWDLNKATNIGEWSRCGGGRSERFYCTYIYIYCVYCIMWWHGMPATCCRLQIIIV